MVDGRTWADVGEGTFITDGTGKTWKATRVRYNVASATVTAVVRDSGGVEREVSRVATHPAVIAWAPPDPGPLSVVGATLGGMEIEDTEGQQR